MLSIHIARFRLELLYYTQLMDVSRLKGTNSNNHQQLHQIDLVVHNKLDLVEVVLDKVLVGSLDLVEVVLVKVFVGSLDLELVGQILVVAVVEELVGSYLVEHQMLVLLAQQCIVALLGLVLLEQ